MSSADVRATYTGYRAEEVPFQAIDVKYAFKVSINALIVKE